MGVEVFTSSDGKRAVLVNNTSDQAFGPVFWEADDGSYRAVEVAERFLVWMDYQGLRLTTIHLEELMEKHQLAGYPTEQKVVL